MAYWPGLHALSQAVLTGLILHLEVRHEGSPALTKHIGFNFQGAQRLSKERRGLSRGVVTYWPLAGLGKGACYGRSRNVRDAP